MRRLALRHSSAGLLTFGRACDPLGRYRPGGGPEQRWQLAACSGAPDAQPHVWDARRPAVALYSLAGHRDVCTGLAWLPASAAPPGTVLLSASKDGMMLRHDLPALDPPYHHVRPTAISWAANDDLVAVSSAYAPESTPRAMRLRPTKRYAAEASGSPLGSRPGSHPGPSPGPSPGRYCVSLREHHAAAATAAASHGTSPLAVAAASPHLPPHASLPPATHSTLSPHVAAHPAPHAALTLLSSPKSSPKSSRRAHDRSPEPSPVHSPAASPRVRRFSLPFSAAPAEASRPTPHPTGPASPPPQLPPRSLVPPAPPPAPPPPRHGGSPTPGFASSDETRVHLRTASQLLVRPPAQRRASWPPALHSTLPQCGR